MSRRIAAIAALTLWAAFATGRRSGILQSRRELAPTVTQLRLDKADKQSQLIDIHGSLDRARLELKTLSRELKELKRTLK
jgi:hypothetical protein